MAWNVVVGIISGVYLLIGIALSYAWFHRRYPPLKAKHIGLLITAFIGCCFWWVGLIQTSGLVPTVGSRVCVVWSLWVEYILGVMVLMYSLTLRLHSLYHCFILRKPLSQRRHFLATLVYFCPIMCVGIYALAVPEDTVRDVENSMEGGNGFDGDCRWKPVLQFLALFAILLAMTMLFWLIRELRSLRRSINEFTESLVAFIGAGMCITLNFLILFLGLTHNSWALMTLLILHLLVVVLYFGMVVGPPLYGYIRYPEVCLRRFITQFRSETHVDIAPHSLPAYPAPMRFK